MASVRSVSGKWQAQVRIKGVSKSRTFATRQEAVLWSERLESGLRASAGPAKAQTQASVPPRFGKPPETFGEVLRFYEERELPKHKSCEVEKYLLAHLHKHWLCDVLCKELRSHHLAVYRDERLLEVKPGSVRRVFNLLRPMLDTARKEWQASLEGNPARDISVRVGDDSRAGRLSALQIDKLMQAVQRRKNKNVVVAIQLALETTMRRSELLSLSWKDVDFQKRVAYINNSKNGSSRVVALTPRAVELLKELPRGRGAVLNCSADAVKTAFQRCKAEAGLTDFCFHQLRHEGISRLWELGLNEVEISSISGHKDWKMLRRYSHVQASSLADKLRLATQGQQYSQIAEN